LLVLAVALSGCPIYGPCCTTKDCPGGNVCSVTDCSNTNNIGGHCTYRCQVDNDCNDPNQVCNTVTDFGVLPDSATGVVCGCTYKTGVDAGCGSCSGCLGR
jgi:hypothetical protein